MNVYLSEKLVLLLDFKLSPGIDGAFSYWAVVIFASWDSGSLANGSFQRFVHMAKRAIIFSRDCSFADVDRPDDHRIPALGTPAVAFFKSRSHSGR